MGNLKFKILDITRLTDITLITAECLKDNEDFEVSIPTLFINDREFIRSAFMDSYLETVGEDVEVGEII